MRFIGTEEQPQPGAKGVGSRAGGGLGALPAASTWPTATGWPRGIWEGGLLLQEGTVVACGAGVGSWV